ncbi:MAG: hypothetical protein NC489_23870 [Ruminococcus flavefaciens]|nr:hypothetical protein [Ruminococcus flavefaciens]
MNKRSRVSLIAGAAALAASIAVFAIVHPKVFPSTILGLCFLLYSEAVLFGGFALVDMLSARASRMLLWSGVGTLTGIYGVIVFISSFIFMAAKTSRICAFLVLQVVLLAIVSVLCLIIGNFSLEAKKKDNKVLQAGATLQYIMDQLALIKEQTGRKVEIDRLIEAVRYSDISVTVDADVEINDAVACLGSLVGGGKPDNDEFEQSMRNIEFLIKKRDLQAKAAKQGGI